MTDAPPAQVGPSAAWSRSAPPAGDTALAIRGLTKSYGELTALAGLTLELTRGEVLALLGPNGAGKTTTVEICEGYRRPDTGEVRVLGLDPIRDATQLRPRVGVMPQAGLGAYPNARVGELVRLFADFARDPLPWRPLLERVGLIEAQGRVVKRLSGGQQQRLSLALAIVGRPELVFLDEPTAGMDPQGRRDTWELVEQLRDDGVSVVLTTHLLDEAERLADTVVVVDRGRAVASGSPAELTRRDATGQVRFGARPGLGLSGMLASLPANTQAEEEAPGRYLVTGRIDPQLLAALTAWCASQGVLAEGLSVERRTLEDVYFQLTERSKR